MPIIAFESLISHIPDRTYHIADLSLFLTACLGQPWLDLLRAVCLDSTFMDKVAEQPSAPVSGLTGSCD